MVKKKIQEIDQTSLIVRDNSQTFTIIDDEIVMLSFNQGEYFALNETASEIWSLIASPILVSNLIQKLMTIYDITFKECMEDTFECLTDLYKKNLIEIVNEG